MNFILMLFISMVLMQVNPLPDERIITDSSLTLEEALSGTDIPENIKKELKLVDVEYYSFDNRLHRGQLLLHSRAAGDIKEIFKVIKRERFPIHKAVPVARYNWSDEASMQDNNTSAFNYRLVKGTKKLSYHAQGLAVDINPMLNPQIKRGKTIPSGAVYNPKTPGTLTRESEVVKAFVKRGWQWGGRWRSTKDYQHFQKMN